LTEGLPGRSGGVQKRYDKQMKEETGVDPAGRTTEEKVAITRKYRTDRFERLTDSVYKRRGWTPQGVPTYERIKELGIDFPEVLKVVKPFLEPA
jgi:aldehyde:ferredoxin oxidoreductase